MDISIEEIKQKYDIITDDLGEIENELLKEIKIHHPDNNFNQPDDYNIGLIKALNDIRNLQKVKKIEEQTPMSDKDLMELKYNNIPAQEIIKIEVLSEKLEDNVETRKILIKKQQWSSASAAFLSAPLFLWILPKVMEEQPPIKKIIERINFNEDTLLAVSYAWLLLVVFFIAKIVRKRKKVKKIEELKYERKQNEIFNSFYYKTIATDSQFSKTDFIFFVYLKLFKRTDDYDGDLFKRFMKKRLRKKKRYDSKALRKFDNKNKKKIEHELSKYEELLQTATDIILLKAQEQELIKKIKSDDLIDKYKMIERKSRYDL